MSWRIPLGIQLIPGILLGLGCLALPPSPRLLVAQGRIDEALTSLARLRLRSPAERSTDPLLQVCLSPLLITSQPHATELLADRAVGDAGGSCAYIPNR